MEVRTSVKQNSTLWDWHILCESQTGDSHLRRNVVNQDYVAQGKCPHPIIVAIADGHGSPRSFRSNVGARLAVEAALATLADFAAETADEPILNLIHDAARQRLPRRLIQHWLGAVQDWHNSQPVTESEWESLEQATNSETRRLLQVACAENDQKSWLILYGSTILATLITDAFALYLQLGDGEIVVISGEEEIPRSPLPEDGSLIANETTSLCLPDCSQYMRVGFSVLHSEPPRLVLLSTDGYPNSFQSRDGFLKVATDLLQMLREEGREVVAQGLPGWLREASEKGSGDDVSLAIVYRANAAVEKPEVERERIASSTQDAEIRPAPFLLLPWIFI